MRKTLGFLFLVLWAALPAHGQEIGKGSGEEANKAIAVTVSGNSVSIEVSLGGLGADLAVSFEEVTGLSLASLGVSARLANLFDPGFWNRLPRGTLPALPLIVRIEPPASGGLSFTGVATLDIHTHNLNFFPQTPLRFFAAPLGGTFTDITQGMGSGSYRARANRGGFSEFMILLDLRAVNQVITSKLDRLDYLLEEYEDSISGPVYADLEARLADIREDFENGATADAIDGVDGFLAEVVEHSGTDIPNVWRAARDVVNVAGYLREGGATLRFSLDLKRASGH